jgi:hypothetical protein
LNSIVKAVKFPCLVLNDFLQLDLILNAVTPNYQVHHQTFFWDLMNESKIFYDKTITAYYVQRRFCSHLQMSNQAVGAATESVLNRFEVLDIRYFTDFQLGHMRLY